MFWNKKNNTNNIIDNGELAYDVCGIQELFVEALKDQGYKDKVPKDFSAQKKAFAKAWGKLSDKEKKSIYDHLDMEDCQTFLSAWSKLQGKLAETLR